MHVATVAPQCVSAVDTGFDRDADAADMTCAAAAVVVVVVEDTAAIAASFADRPGSCHFADMYLGSHCWRFYVVGFGAGSRVVVGGGVAAAAAAGVEFVVVAGSGGGQKPSLKG